MHTQNIINNRSSQHSALHRILQELASYADLEGDLEEAQLTRREISHTRKKVHESMTKIGEKARQPEEGLPKRKTRRKTTLPARLAKERRAEDEEAVAKTEVITRTEVIATTEAPLTKRAKKRRRGKSRVCAVGVCKPEICCADLEGKLPFRMTFFPSVNETILFSALRDAKHSIRHVNGQVRPPRG